jgi:predicted O-methyltransferase YrrM
MEYLSRRGFPRRIVEIGTGRAGSTYFWSRLVPEGGQVVTVDVEETGAQLVEIFRPRARGSLTCLIDDSHSDETATRVRDALHERPADLLFIDGDHTYDGARRDFELYEPLVDPSGLIAFHDITVTGRADTQSLSGEVWRLWGCLKDRYTTREFVDGPRDNGFGIGVIEPPRRASSALI